MLWHQRLGHIGEKGLRLLHGEGMVEGVSNFSLDFDLCEGTVKVWLKVSRYHRGKLWFDQPLMITIGLIHRITRLPNIREAIPKTIDPTA
jgi:hypothetical protein